VDNREDRIRQENPTFPITMYDADNVPRFVNVNPDEFPEWYEELIAERIAWASDADALISEEQDRRVLRRQFMSGMSRLESNLTVLRGTATSGPNWPTLTTAQRQEALRQGLIDVTQGQLWLANVLKNSGIFSREDEEE
jgi:hypothetical protein